MLPYTRRNMQAGLMSSDMKDGLYFDIEPKFPGEYPVLPLRDTVLFPLHIVPLFIGRQKSIGAVEYALATDRLLILTAQKQVNDESPTPEGLYSVGTIGLIMRMLRDKKSPDRLKILVQGICKASILKIIYSEPFYIAALEKKETGKVMENKQVVLDLIASVKEKLDRLIFTSGKKIPTDIMVVIETLEDPEKLANLIAGNVGLAVPQAQEILELDDPIQKLTRVDGILDGLTSQ